MVVQGHTHRISSRTSDIEDKQASFHRTSHVESTLVISTMIIQCELDSTLQVIQPRKVGVSFVLLSRTVDLPLFTLGLLARGLLADLGSSSDEERRYISLVICCLGIEKEGTICPDIC